VVTVLSHNGSETLGLRPALRQAAPGRRRGRVERRSDSNQATGLRLRSVGRTTGPLRGTRCASSFSTPYASAPGGIAGAACLRDIPFGNEVSRWTFDEMGSCRDSRSKPNA
jgi:hypothetical protein